MNSFLKRKAHETNNEPSTLKKLHSGEEENSSVSEFETNEMPFPKENKENQDNFLSPTKTTETSV